MPLQNSVRFRLWSCFGNLLPWRMPVFPSIVLLLVLFFDAPWTLAEDPAEALIDAARRGDQAEVQKLLADGVDINSAPKFNITALWQAVSKEHHDVIEVLLEAGADPDITDSVWQVPPLMLTNNLEIISLLVAHDASATGVKLREASAGGSIELVKTIVEAKALDDQTLSDALAQAVNSKQEEVVSFLHETTNHRLPAAPTVATELLESYAGKYIGLRMNEVEIHVDNGHLIYGSPGAGGIQLVPRSNTQFQSGGYTYEFDVKPDGTASYTRLSLTNRLTFKKIGDQTDPDAPTAQNNTLSPSKDWLADTEIAAHDTWPQFRGIGGRGIAVDQNLPVTWNVEAEENLQWKIPIPGLGNSCPISWKDRLFVTTAISGDGNHNLRIGLYGDIEATNDTSVHTWLTMCFDRHTGDLIWQHKADERLPPTGRHTKSSQANPTPVTDGENLIVLLNSGLLICYSLDGEVRWQNDLGELNSGMFSDPDYEWGFGSSPIIYDQTVILQCDLQQDSFVVAFDVTSGTEVWRTARDEVPSWGTPSVMTAKPCPLLVTNGTNFIRGYDARSGTEIWRLTRNAAITVPTPQVAHKLIYVTSGYRPVQPIYAIRPDAEGDISLVDGEASNQTIVWSKDRGGPYLATPLVYGNYLYTCGNNGVFTCYDALTGERVYRKRCSRGEANSFTASPVAADGIIYVTSEVGVVLAVRAGPEFEIVGENDLGDICLATPLIAGGTFIARTQHYLIAIGK